MCKKSITNSQMFVKKMKKMSGPLGGGIFFDSHCTKQSPSTLFTAIVHHGT